MDLSEDALAELDFVVGSVHSFLNLEAAEMTERLLRALESPNLKLLGHPTGRQLLRREAYPFDFQRVVRQAVDRNVRLEINGSPERMDLGSGYVRQAKALGAKFAISTDSHHPNSLGVNMPYGVLMARRGWLEASDVLNTLPVDQFASAIKKQ
jgi:DNA polymerase (family 10)